jgi:acyl-homoserine lactone acylase PvdQ
MQKSNRLRFVPVVALALISPLALAALHLVSRSVLRASDQAKAAEPAEILWDRWGVPHIFASSMAPVS